MREKIIRALAKCSIVTRTQTFILYCNPVDSFQVPGSKWLHNIMSTANGSRAHHCTAGWDEFVPYYYYYYYSARSSWGRNAWATTYRFLKFTNVTWRRRRTRKHTFWIYYNKIMLFFFFLLYHIHTIRAHRDTRRSRCSIRSLERFGKGLDRLGRIERGEFDVSHNGRKRKKKSFKRTKFYPE